MRPEARDLFGEIPVTLADVLAWMLAVPGIAPSSPRFGYYVRWYDVVGKIRAAKLAGRFDAIISSTHEPPPFKLAAAVDLAAAVRARRLSSGR